MDQTTCLVIVLIVIVAVGGYLWFRRRGAAESAAKQMTSGASSMASGATDATKGAAAGAASMTTDAASSATDATKGAAAGAASMTSDAASTAGTAVTDTAGGASAAMAGAMGAAAGAASQMDMGQMTDALNGIMSGNVDLDPNSPLGKMITPMADGITSKLGLPKGVGAMVVAFALTKIVELLKARQGGTGDTMVKGMSTDEVLGKLSTGGGMDAGGMQSASMNTELASKTGLSEAQAKSSLQMALGALKAGMSGQKTYEGMDLPDMSMLTSMMK